MNRLFLAGGLLAGLSCANPSLETEAINLPLEKTLELSLIENEDYTLAEDSVRLSALRKFHKDSIDPQVFEKYSEDNLVLVKTQDHIAHGYMIDDSGLVLTVEHMAKRINQNGKVNGVIVTSGGLEYPIRSTEISNDLIDYAIIVAETDKEPKTHPLHFSNSLIPLCDLDASFFTYASFDVNYPLPHEGGYVICMEHALPVVKNTKLEHKGIHLEFLLRLGSSFISEGVEHGDSGTPVFANLYGNNPLFLGLARATILDNEGLPLEDFGVITSSSDIIDSISYYLDDLDSP